MAERWWERPFRIFQTNIREIDAGLDVEAVADDIVGFGANAWLLNGAGIVSFYPSKLPYQHPSPWLRERPSGDLLGDAVAAAHKRDVRVIARCDFSKLHADVYEAHPDWFYVSPAGVPQIYNGMYSACPCGPYYQEKAFEILAEVMDGYGIDGFFFNMFNHPLRDYSGQYHGICQCVHCQTAFRAATGLDLPKAEVWSDPAYAAWKEWSRSVISALSRRVREFIEARNPNVALVQRQNSHVLFNEVNNAVDRPLPLWRYWAGDFARETRTAFPDRPAVQNAVMFLDIPYRFSAEQPGLVGLHLQQTISQGVNPYAYVVGTTRNQPDRKNFSIVRRMLSFHRDHQDVYTGLRSAAKVAIISSLRSSERLARALGSGAGLEAVEDARRGAFRALVEGHVPFDILPDDQLVAAANDGRLARYAALVLPNIAVLDDDQSAVLDRFVEAGGGLVATHETASYSADGRLRSEIGLQSLGARRVLSRRSGPAAVDPSRPGGTHRPLRSAYLRVTDRADLPGFDETDLVMLDRAFLTVEARGGATGSLTLVPASRYGPPEKIYFDIEATEHPGRLAHKHGAGRTVYFPWPVDGLFYHHSLPEHRALLVRAVVEVAGGSQVQASAPPQVEVVLGVAGDGRCVVHLINHSGHQDRSYHEPLPVYEIGLALDLGDAALSGARALVSQADLPVMRDAAGRVCLTLPRLADFEVIVLGG
ncbi:MAG: alpha-amylase family protein [Chloroflexota bacterium]